MADTDNKPDKYEAELAQAIDYLRGNVKWTLLAFGAIGATLLAGSQLSNLGKFAIHEPRLWAALAFAVLALGAASYAVRSTLAVMYGDRVDLAQLKAEDLTYVAQNPALLEGYASVAKLLGAYDEAIEKRFHDLGTKGSTVELLESNEHRYEYLDSLCEKARAYIRHNRLWRQAERSRNDLTWASLVAAIALVGFAWAANPANTPTTPAKSSTDAPAKVAVAASALVNVPTPTVEQPIIWTQLRPDAPGATGQLIARAIVTRGTPCPKLTVNDATWPMVTRIDGSDPDFSVRICEAALPGDAKVMQLGKTELKPRPRDPRRIVVIGDTGCRITDYAAQTCDSAVDWPFFRVAAAAAAVKPDLVIHVGDYHYREKPCAGRAGCTDSPWGDNWATWDAEFFKPAAPLLSSAPWLMLRGNHEDCTRAGAGWNLLIRPILGLVRGERCPPDADPDVFAFDNLQMVAPDTASAEGHGREDRVVTYRNHIRNLSKRLDKTADSWLLVHQALLVGYGFSEALKTYDTADLYSRVFQTLDPAAREDICQSIIDPMNTYRQWLDGSVPATNPNEANPDPRQRGERPCREEKKPATPLSTPNISLVLSGDTHTFQMFAPDGKHPLQLVVGNGGDFLEASKKFPGSNNALTDKTANLFGVTGKLWMRNTFGFAVLEKPEGASSWIARLYDADGKTIAICDLKRPGGGCK